MDWAFKRKKPIFGICRGFQLMNVYFGGSLYQDLSLETQTPVEHRNAETYDRVHHEVVCPEQSLLTKIYSKDRFFVNSVHHQGVKTLGRGLVVDATSPADGLVEAFHQETPNDHLVMGVQWHPEFSHTLQGTVVDPKPLLDYFLEHTK